MLHSHAPAGFNQPIPTVLPDYHTTIFDETSGFNQVLLNEHGITKVEAVYLFNKNQHIHHAELTPSYELMHADFLFESIHEHGTPENDRAHEALLDAYAMSEKYLSVPVGSLKNTKPHSSFANWPEHMQAAYLAGELTRLEADEEILGEYRANPTRH